MEGNRFGDRDESEALEADDVRIGILDEDGVRAGDTGVLRCSWTDC